MDWVFVRGQEFYKVCIPYLGTEHLLYARHCIRCLKYEIVYNVDPLFNKLKFITVDNLVLWNHLRGHPEQIWQAEESSQSLSFEELEEYILSFF